MVQKFGPKVWKKLHSIERGESDTNGINQCRLLGIDSNMAEYCMHIPPSNQIDQIPYKHQRSISKIMLYQQHLSCGGPNGCANPEVFIGDDLVMIQ